MWITSSFVGFGFGRKLHLSASQNHTFEDSTQAAYILYCGNASFPHVAYSLTADLPHCAKGQGAEMLLKGENV